MIINMITVLPSQNVPWQVIRKFEMIAENNTYFLHVGPRVDVAFLVLATFAIDELFTDDWLSIIDPILYFY